jgi:protein-disulfide isomerase
MDRKTRLAIVAMLVTLMVSILFVFRQEAGPGAAALLEDPDSPAIGNPYGNPVTVVVFSDYHCAPCKDLSTELEALTQEDTHLRVIFKEYPILGENSVLAARAALAVNFANDRRYFPYHQALMRAQEAFTPETLAAAAVASGVEPAAFSRQLHNPKIDEEIERNGKLAQSLGFHGVPTVVIGHKILPGGGMERIKSAIAEMRTRPAMQ